MSAAIDVIDLHKSYGPVQAVRGISFEVAQGEVVAVLGPNGAGKTSTVEVLEGYRQPDSGSVKVLGFDPGRSNPQFRQRIGIVLQSCGIDPYLTVSEVLAMHAGYYRSPRPIDEVIELVGLTDKAGSRVKRLSGGQQRRLDLALGLIGDPELLFLDEPTTGFDPTARRQAWDIVRNLAGLGKTILLTTHYMDEAQALADRVIVISAGQIVAEGAPDAIGGRALAKARIGFTLPPGISARELPLPIGPNPSGPVGVEVTVEGSDVVVHTAEPTPVLHRLTSWAVERSVDLPGLTVTRPSLEDIYLDLTATPEAS
jgi:ABC-2 type transport system ATP-binding protein